jgi:hypothetical protein
LKNQPVRFGFGFINKKLKKLNRTETEKNRAKTEPEPSQTGKTEPNWFEPVFSLKNRTEPNKTKTGRFDLVSVRFQFFFKKISVWLFFFIKTEPN